MNNDSPNLVPLQYASLCLDCEVISAAPTQCPACGSRALMSIARALSRPAYPGLVYREPAGMAQVRPQRAGDFWHST